MSSLLHYFILVATDLPHSYCCCCQNLCWGSVHWHRLQNVQLSPIVSCAGTACMEKRKTKIFSPIHVSKFVPRGFLSVFSYFSGWKLFTEQEEASGMQEEEGRAAWGGMRCLGNTEAQPNEAAGEGWSDGCLFLRQLRRIPLPACCTGSAWHRALSCSQTGLAVSNMSASGG